VLSLNRFKAEHVQNEKIQDLVEFPVIGLNLSSFVESPAADCVYDLIGVVNHHGVLNRGHYRAVAKSAKGPWVVYDDESVDAIDPEHIVSAGAYVLFYQRRDP
jgi:ubiquitin C-terminal hydrolase